MTNTVFGNGVHVVPAAPGWAVEMGGTANTSPYGTLEAAIAAATALAKQHKADLFIHNRDGTVLLQNSFANDPSVGPADTDC